jgi:hypothetical protein
MSGTNDSFYSIKVISFSGKKKDWDAWEEKFLAKAKRKGYKGVLMGTNQIPQDSEILDPTVDTDKIKIETREMNELAYSELILSMDTRESAGKIAFNIVKRSKSTDYADGNALVAWKGLKRKYSPTTAPSLAKLHKQFYRARLKKKVDPDVFITYLEDIRTRMEEMGSKMTDEQFMLHVMNNLSSDYENQVNKVEDRVGNKTNPLDIEELRDELCLRFERLNTKEDSDESEDEKALFGAQFKGRCRVCGKWGHKGTECRSNKETKGNGNKQTSNYKKFEGECHYCHKKGHMKKDCFKRKNDEGEQANQAKESKKTKKDDDDDIVLMAFDDDDNESQDEMVVLLRSVATAKNISSQHIDSWVDGVRGKLKLVDIEAVSNLRYGILTLNEKLRQQGITVFHQTTLELMLNKGLDDVEERWAIAEDRIIELEEQLKMANKKSDGDETTDTEWSKIENETTRDENKDLDEGETSLLNVDIEFDTKSKDKITPTTWLGDTGASCHLTNSDDGMFDVQVIKSPVKIGSGKTMNATKIGKKRLTVMQKDGSTQDVVLTDVKFVPELWVNLFSIGKALQNGFNIGNKGIRIHLEKGNTKLIFDRIMPTSKGFVVGMEMLPTTRNRGNMAIVALDKGQRVKMKDLHGLLTHVGEDTARKTAKHYEWEVYGTLEPCNHCATAKARQKNMNKSVESKSEIPGERLLLDSSSVKGLSYGNKKFWQLVVDDCSNLGFSDFLIRKNETEKKVVKLIKDLKAKHGKIVKYIRCDNAGENVRLEAACKKEGLGIQFEFTAPGTPQQNGKVERKFATLYARVRAMLNQAGVTETLRHGLWAEAAATATLIENAVVTKQRNKSPHEEFYGVEPKYVRNLRTFGEVGVVLNHALGKSRGKLKDRGRPCLFLGYGRNQAEDVYRMFNLETRKVITTRDVIWLNKTYGEFKKTKTEPSTEDDDEEDYDYFKDQQAGRELDDEVIILEPEDASDAESDDKSEEEIEDDLPADKMNPRLAREMKKLGGWFNPTATARVTRQSQQAEMETQKDDSPSEGREEAPDTASIMMDRHNSDLSPDFAILNIDISKGYKMVEMVDYDKMIEPTKYKDAWDHPEKFQREKWREAINTEMKNMAQRKVFKKIKRVNMPKGRRCVKHKWVFKIKRNGVFRSRLVACGYSQIPGVDYTENYAPVISDVTYRILLICEIVWGLTSKIVDVETAFLHGDLEEGQEIYMDCPESLEHEEDECLLLQKTIYGLVQSARQFFKKLVTCLKTFGFIGGAADPCLLTRKNSKGIVFIGIYVDDCYCCGHEAAIDETISQLKASGFGIKVEDNLTDYLSCNIVFDKKKTKAWLGQPHLIKNLDEKFGKLVDNLQKYRTPGTPGLRVTRPAKDEPNTTVSEEDKTLYKSGVGMLLYLVKHSRPDIANVVRELSKMMDGATPAAFKELKRTIKFVLDTRTFGLRIEPKMGNEEKWSMTIFTDSEYAGDTETRISVGGFIIFLLGVPILWKSKAQRAVTLSSSEAEFVSLSEAAKEIKFVVQILESMGIVVEIPIIVRVDNVGAIFMSENASTSSRTRHVDIRYHFVREYVEEGFIRIIFVRSEENLADGFTKNVTGDIYDAHVKEFMSEKEALNIE